MIQLKKNFLIDYEYVLVIYENIALDEILQTL